MQVTDDGGAISETSTGGSVGTATKDSGLRDPMSARQLTDVARRLRRHIVTMTAIAGSGHPGGSLSAVEIVACLYFRVLRHRPGEPKWPERDRFVLSKAHACPVLYAALAESGYFPTIELTATCASASGRTRLSPESARSSMGKHCRKRS